MSDEDELTAAERELEQALRSLRPTPARLDLLAAALAASRRASHRPRRWQAAASAAIVAAGGAWLSFGPRGQGPPHAAGPDFTEAPDVVAAADADVEPPTELVYRRAIMRSPTEFDALLDQHAMTGGAADVEVTPVGVARFWESVDHPSSGDM